MPTISTFHGIVVQMFWRDHNPPHFHASYGGEEVVVEIRTLAIMEGSISRRALPMLLEWALAHQAELLEDWELCQLKQRPNRIDPLP
jgi:hypothetical protein